MATLLRLVLVLYSLLVGSILVQCTEIKWTPGTSSDGTSTGSNPNQPDAKTAPRSQRYWDEHGIERPDYAKTDAEIAAEKKGGGGQAKDGADSAGGGDSIGKGSALSPLVRLVLLGIIVAMIRYRHRYPELVEYFKSLQGAGGHKLNGKTVTESLLAALVPTKSMSEEDERERARQARLERFRESIKEE